MPHPSLLEADFTAKPVLAPNSGSPDRLGATITSEGVNFAVYSETASAVWVSLFDETDQEIGRFELDGHQDNIHFGLVAGIGAGARYGFRTDGPYDPAQGFFFDPHKLLVDPYALRIDRTYVRSPRLRLPREDAVDTAPLIPKAIVTGAQRRPQMPRRRGPSLVYELNVRGYTMRHPSVQGPLRGTVAGLTTRQVIDHLHFLGVDCVELMPVAAFIDDGHLPILGLTNAWGYNPVSYFAIDPRLAPRGPQELRNMTDLYRKNGISVILDVVYNHTGEGDDRGPILSLKGLDARTYYRFAEADGRQVLVNDSGTGNTLRNDHPATQRLVIDSLKYWIQETGVSGFRFDLAPVLGREPGFNPNAALLQKLKADPILSRAVLIAEPWDPGPGGYQLGQFGREFREWNDTYRDEVRSFWRGDDWTVGALARKLAGSSEIFHHAGRKATSSVNFLAVHDGFTLRDLVSYNDKHNEANGEDNRDGHSNNYSWNCGTEGETDDEAIKAMRRRDVRALLATLYLSRGTTLLQQGDEMWRTQQGNNNAYAQDNEITWVDWEHADGALVDYVAALQGFRLAHPCLDGERFLTGQTRNGVKDVVWRSISGNEMDNGEWDDPYTSVLGMHLDVHGDEVLVWFNRMAEPAEIDLGPTGQRWAIGIQSDDKAEVVLERDRLVMPPRSVLALVPSKEPEPGDGADAPQDSVPSAEPQAEPAEQIGAPQGGQE